MKHEDINPKSKYIGTDAGNPGLDIVAQNVDHEGVMSDDLLRIKSYADKSADFSHARRRNSREGRFGRSRVFGATALTAAAVAAVGVVSKLDSPKESAGNPDVAAQMADRDSAAGSSDFYLDRGVKPIVPGESSNNK